MSNTASTCPVDCPHCRQRLQVPLAHVGKQGRCPHCKSVFRIDPSAPIPAQAAEPAPASFSAPAQSVWPLAPPNPPPTLDEYQLAPQSPAWTPGPSPFGEAPAPFSATSSPFGQQASPYGMASLPPASLSAPPSFAASNNPPASQESSWNDGELSGMQRFGIVIFVVASGLMALNAGGFMGRPIWFPLALLISTIGGVVGGAMLARTHRWAGAIGGLIAGPLGLIAIALYISGRQQVWNVELAIVQCVACLPGIAVYRGLKWLAG
jgi:hypothetical protein